MTDCLVNICRGHIMRAARGVTVPEPYIPYIPDRWNRCLVLAEAQNHGAKSREYLKWLKGLGQRDRLLRLYLQNGRVGCQPWDDGSLKLALAAAFDVDPERWAVCNGVLWSSVDKSGRNINPSTRSQQRSAALWSEFLDVLRPTLVVTAGKVARDVIDAACPEGGCPRVALKLPAPSYLSRASGLFDHEDLLARYPEVRAVAERHPEWLGGKYERNKILFACHAVSLTRALTRQRSTTEN